MRISAMFGLSALLVAALPAQACEDYIEARATEQTVAQAVEPVSAAAPAALDLSAATTKKAKKTTKKKREKVEYMRAAN
jgi:hypothetical protein